MKGARHFVFQAPFRKGAYYGPAAFAEQMWKRVQPLARAASGLIILLGLSRGGLVAIDAALRMVSELGRRTSVLALSLRATQRGRLRATVLWGAQDSLLDAVECEPVPRAASASAARNHWLTTALVPNQAHALGRGGHQPHTEVAGRLERIGLESVMQEQAEAALRSTERVSS